MNDALGTNDPLWKWDAVRLAQAIRTREVSCVEAVGSVVDRIRTANPPLNAVTVDLGAEALAQAEAADRALAAGDVDPGPLFGVPITIKENIDVAGQATPNGLPALADLIAPADSPFVAHMKRAGAIIVGRTNTPELSMRVTTWNPLRGRTNNPWRLDASPGGSSGGAGAAAAAGFGPLHHGNDIAGSLRFPAFACGVTTIKPTQGRIAAFNPSATAERGLLSTLMSTQGVIARSVADVRLGTRVVSAGDPRDPWWVPAPFDGPPEPAPIKVAVARATHGYPIHPGIVELIDRTAARLADAGYQVEEAEPPSIEEAFRGWFTTGVTEVKATLDKAAREMGSAELQEIFERYYSLGEIVDFDGYRLGLADRTRQARNWSVFLATYPLVLTPLLMRPGFSGNFDAEPGGAEDLFRASMYSCGINYVGLPAGLVPVDLVDGLPAGVQIVGRRYREDLVLDAMAAIEARSDRLIDRLWARDAA